MRVRNAVLVELQKAGSYIRYNKILHTSKINKQSNVQYIYTKSYLDLLQEKKLANVPIANININ
jgi:hypothetical protein